MISLFLQKKLTVFCPSDELCSLKLVFPVFKRHLSKGLARKPENTNNKSRTKEHPVESTYRTSKVYPFFEIHFLASTHSDEHSLFTLMNVFLTLHLELGVAHAVSHFLEGTFKPRISSRTN